MRAKVAAVLAGLAAAGALVAALSSGRTSGPAGDHDSLFPRVSPHAVTELAIRDRADEVRLVRAGKAWRLTSPVDDAADPRRVEEALAGLARITLSNEPVAADPSAWARYEVADDEVLTAVVKQGGRHLPALHLGRSGFARVGDDPRIYEVPEFRRDVLERELSEWRDLAVLELGDEEITAIEVIDARGRRARADRAPGSEREAARALPADAWVLTAGAEHAEPFDPAVPASLLRYLLALRGADVADGPIAREAIAEPALRIRLLSDAGVRELLLGGRIDTKTALGTASGERVWLLSHPQAKQLLKGPRQWRHKQVVHADPAHIVAVEVRRGEQRLRAVRSSRWRLEYPPDAAIDLRAADAFARRFSPLMADEVAEPEIELPDGAATVTLELRDGDTLSLAIGERSDGTFVVASSERRDLLVLHRQRAEALLVDAFGLIHDR
jgi:hypothetical protein